MLLIVISVSNHGRFGFIELIPWSWKYSKTILRVWIEDSRELEIIVKSSTYVTLLIRSFEGKNLFDCVPIIFVGRDKKAASLIALLKKSHDA